MWQKQKQKWWMANKLSWRSDSCWGQRAQRAGHQRGHYLCICLWLQSKVLKIDTSAPAKALPKEKQHEHTHTNDVFCHSSVCLSVKICGLLWYYIHNSLKKNYVLQFQSIVLNSCHLAQCPQFNVYVHVCEKEKKIKREWESSGSHWVWHYFTDKKIYRPKKQMEECSTK